MNMNKTAIAALAAVALMTVTAGNAYGQTTLDPDLGVPQDVKIEGYLPGDVRIIWNHLDVPDPDEIRYSAQAFDNGEWIEIGYTNHTHTGATWYSFGDVLQMRVFTVNTTADTRSTYVNVDATGPMPGPSALSASGDLISDYIDIEFDPISSTDNVPSGSDLIYQVEADDGGGYWYPVDHVPHEGNNRHSVSIPTGQFNYANSVKLRVGAYIYTPDFNFLDGIGANNSTLADLNDPIDPSYTFRGTVGSYHYSEEYTDSVTVTRPALGNQGPTNFRIQGALGTDVSYSFTGIPGSDHNTAYLIEFRDLRYSNAWHEWYILFDYETTGTLPTWILYDPILYEELNLEDVPEAISFRLSGLHYNPESGNEIQTAYSNVVHVRP